MKGGLLLDAMPSQNPEAQERARVVGQLTRVGNTRLDGQDVFENLCLESLGSVFELPPPMEGTLNLMLVSRTQINPSLCMIKSMTYYSIESANA